MMAICSFVKKYVNNKENFLLLAAAQQNPLTDDTLFINWEERETNSPHSEGKMPKR